MGKYDDAMYRYLSDNDRFADLFNAVLFDGRSVVRGEMLEDASERCLDVFLDETSRAETEGQPRYEKSVRDIRKRMKTGECLIITAIENQNDIDYAMPWRIMRYDQMEYGRQIRDIISSRRAALQKQGRSGGNWIRRLRQDKDGLRELWGGEAFSHLDLETAQTMAVMTDSTDLLKKLEITEEGGCNMCLAVEEMRRDWMAEGKIEGKIEGRIEGKIEGKAEGKAEGIIAMGMEYGLSEDAILEKLQNILDISLQTAMEYLGMFRKKTV